MFTRILLASAAIAVLALSQSAVAADKTHEGKVVSTAEGKLVMTGKDDKGEHSHAIADATKVTLDGKSAKITDLHKGDMVKVTTDDSGKVSAVAATRSK